MATRSPKTRRATPTVRRRMRADAMGSTHWSRPTRAARAITIGCPRKYKPNQRPLFTMNWLSKNGRTDGGGESAYRRPAPSRRAWNW
jgi:hypothetical protein